MRNGCRHLRRPVRPLRFPADPRDSTPHATTDEIENTYMTLVKVWHPDRFAHDPRLRKDAEEKLKEINAAHDYLLAHPKQAPPRPSEKPSIPERPFRFFRL